MPSEKEETTLSAFNHTACGPARPLHRLLLLRYIMVDSVAADVRAALSRFGYGSTNVDLTETWSLPNVTPERAEYFKALGASLVRAPFRI